MIMEDRAASWACPDSSGLSRAGMALSLQVLKSLTEMCLATSGSAEAWALELQTVKISYSFVCAGTDVMHQTCWLLQGAIGGRHGPVFCCTLALCVVSWHSILPDTALQALDIACN